MDTSSPPRDAAGRLALAGGLLIALISLEVNAQNVIDVPAEQPTIQSAIDAAVNGDSVVVAPGTYDEVLNFHGKAIALLSADGPLVTIIDGQQRDSLLTFESGETPSSMVSGFTLRNGMGSFGSAIDALGASPTIVDNIIEANIGGAIWGNSSSMVLQRNLFANHASCGSWGVVAFVNGSSPSIKNNVFINNRCPGLNLTLPEGNVPDVANNTFIDNDVGVFVDARIPTSLHRYRNNLFFRNTIGVQVGFGSAPNYPTFVNTLAFANTTAFDGMPSPIGSSGNIAADPRLGGITAFDYRPDTGSAAIDAGVNGAVGGGEVDYHGDTRIRGGTVDIGAAEYVGPQPVVSLSSSREWIALGESFTLTWTSSNSSTCEAAGAWDGSLSLNGSNSVTPASPGTLTYKVICRNSSAARAGVVAIPVYPPPTVSLSLFASAIQQDTTTVLSWSTVTATSCTANGAWTGSTALSGTLVVGPPAPGTYRYELTCGGPGGTTTASAELTVIARPTIQMTIDHADAAVGDTATLTWSVAGATSCEAWGEWSGPKPFNGTQRVGPLPIGSYNYVLQCMGDGGFAVSQAVFTVHPPPQVAMAAVPAGIQLGGTSTIFWISENAASCAASGAWSGSLAGAGSHEVTPADPGSHTFVLTCTGPGGVGSAAATLQVFAPPTVTIALLATTILKGESTSLNWSSSDATNCTASNAWSGKVATSGTRTVSQAAAGSYVYQIMCSGAGGTATSTVTLTVNEPASPPPPSSGGSSGSGGGGAFNAALLSVLGLLLLLRRLAISLSPALPPVKRMRGLPRTVTEVTPPL